MLEALLLTALGGNTGSIAHAGEPPPPPSLELLEFLGEFADDEEGLLDGEEDLAAVKPPPAPAPKPAPPNQENRS